MPYLRVLANDNDGVSSVDRLLLGEIVCFEIDLKFVFWFDPLPALLPYGFLDSIIFRFMHCIWQLELVPQTMFLSAVKSAGPQCSIVVSPTLEFGGTVSQPCAYTQVQVDTDSAY